MNILQDEIEKTNYAVIAACPDHNTTTNYNYILHKKYPSKF